MQRSVFFLTHCVALIGALVLTLALGGCGTLPLPAADDARSGLVPPGRGAP